MKRMFFFNLAMFFLVLATSPGAVAALTTEKFEIEGLISPASPTTLIAALEENLKVKVVNLNLKNTESGWPVLSVEFDTDKLSREEVENAISVIEDPAGHKYRVRKGPPTNNTAYTEEEKTAMTLFGPAPPNISVIANPVEASAESIRRGKTLYENYCTTCHGLSGGGQGPAAHGIMTFPRQLWVWNNADSSADGYLYWFITNGRNEMPPWGVILSETERWDVINYIKTLKKPG